jgi:hypothetical protein
MWTFLRDSLHQCIENHPVCSASQDAQWFPSRLLHLRSPSTGDKVLLKLVETAHHRPSSRYITLSHCWGRTAHICTTTLNLDSHYKGILFSNLPQTFKDCITVARKLGIYYVWIDSLCIIQDQRADWARQSGMMGKVYENALFTVTAVSSPDSSTPFLGPDAPTSRGQYRHHNIDVSALSKTMPIVKARKVGPEILHIQGPLEYRAWAWQERRLSVRTVDFTEQQVHWHCATVNTGEWHGTQVESEWKVTKETEVKTVKKWRADVEDYCSRQLTFWTDRLPALSGIASRYSMDVKSEYLAGLWLSDFPRCLGWYRRELSDCPTGKPCMQRSLENGVPSWSWASISDRVMWLWETDFDRKYWNGTEIAVKGDHDVPIKACVELVSYKCKPLNPDDGFGEVEHGSFVELKGRVVEAEMESDVHGCGLVRRKGWGPQLMIPDCCLIGKHGLRSSKFSMLGAFKSERLNTNSIQPRRAAPADQIKASHESRRSAGPVICLLLFMKEKNEETRPCFLVLGKQTRSNEELPQCYERLGISAGNLNCNGPLYKSRKDWDCWEGWEDLGLWENWEEWFADAEEKILRIV